MKRKIFEKIVALGMAAAIALPLFSIAAAADGSISDAVEKIGSGRIYYATNQNSEYYTVYYSKSTKLYYDNYSTAVAASPNPNYVLAYYSLYTANDLNRGKGTVRMLVPDESDSSETAKNDSSSRYPYVVYYSTSTKKYYDKYQTAVSESPNSDYVRAYKSAYTATQLNSGRGRVGPRINDIDSVVSSETGSKSSSKNASGVTIGKSKGWKAVVRTINSAEDGSSYTVEMNNESEISRDALKALKDKDVTVSFKYSNGAVISINGEDITSAKAFSPTLKTNAKGIPSSLKDKAVKSNDAVSSTQIRISGKSFGCTASVTVKLSSKRAGCTAKLYRYDSENEELDYVSKSTIKSSGKCEFGGISSGGYYLIVICE